MESAIAIINATIRELPQKPGVYRMLDADGIILYIGKAKKLPLRLRSYTQPTSNRMQRMVAQIRRIEWTVTTSEAEAFLLEAQLIKRHKPRFNILLRDDKSYPYIAFENDHAFPRIAKYRGKKEQTGTRYFGPYASAKDVQKMLVQLQKLFQLRSCSDSYFNARTRPCLLYQIKRCSAPCVGHISQQDYAQSARQATEFLSGEADAIRRDWQVRMEEASASMHYEEAAQYRDRIKNLQVITQPTHFMNVPKGSDVDAFVACREGARLGIYVFSFRGGLYYGDRFYCLETIAAEDVQESMETFLGQFYQSHPIPPLILLPPSIDDIPLWGSADLSVMAKALRALADHAVQIDVPKRGPSHQLLLHMQEAAHEKLVTHAKAVTANDALYEALESIVAVPHPIQRIEVYDNSHIQGSHAVGGYIVATRQGLDNKAYRHYTIRTPQSRGGDDYGMLREVLTRRFARLKKECPAYHETIWPDLLLIDGGKGHLSVAMECMSHFQLSIPLLCIAKGPDRDSGNEMFFTPQRPEGFSLAGMPDLLRYLQVIRDEAHRFAISFHRKRRSDQIRATPLSRIPGIGALRQRQLIHYFGSLQALQEASLEQLQQVPAIGKKVAQQLYNALHLPNS